MQWEQRAGHRGMAQKWCLFYEFNLQKTEQLEYGQGRRASRAFEPAGELPMEVIKILMQSGENRHGIVDPA